ncbi:MAG: glycosyltransferase [Chthoniobacterales bacterium]
MSLPRLHLSLSRTGKDFSGVCDWPVPPAILAGLTETADSNALELVLISPDAERVTEKLPAETRAAWLPPDSEGRVNEMQLRLAAELGCSAIFAGDTALKTNGAIPVFHIANYPGILRREAREKPFPLGLVGPDFHFAVESEHPWRNRVVEPLMKTFPCLSYLENCSRSAREYRAQCDLTALCGGSEGRFAPAFLEILLDGSGLVTERSVILEKLGFADGVNCLFITPEQAVAKCAALLADPERLRLIQENGRQLGRKILAQSGAGIVRAWWLAQEQDRKFTSEPGQDHRPRGVLDFLFHRL